MPAGVPAGAFGSRLHAGPAGAYRLGKRPIRQLAPARFGRSIATGMVAQRERSTAAALRPPMAERESPLRTPPANVDETSGREAKHRAGRWVVGTPPVTVFRIAATRCGQVAGELRGAAFRQVVASDRCKAYNRFRRRRFCGPPLGRDFQAMIDRRNGGTPAGEVLLALADPLFVRWHRTWARSGFQV